MASYVRLDHARAAHNDIVVVNWCLSNVCNYSCSYCPTDLHDHSQPFPEFDVVKSFSDRVIDHYRALGRKKVYFEFTGGEVTLWKDLLRLCDHLKSRDADVGFISNGSRAMAWWEKAAPHFDHVCLSYHSEFAKRDHFFEVVKYLRERVKVHVNLMMKPEKFAECYNLAVDVAALGNVTMALQPLIVDFGTQLYPYTSEQEELLRTQQEKLTGSIHHTKEYKTYRGEMDMVGSDGQKSRVAPHELIARNMTNWQGWECNIGLEQIVIDFGGNISRGWCGVGGKIGHISDPNLRLPTRAVTCTKSNCHCNFDIMCTKFRPDTKAMAAELS